MKRSDIEVGKTYANKSEMRTKRVIALNETPGQPSLYMTRVTFFDSKENRNSTVWLDQFARWAHHEVAGRAAEGT